MSERPGTIVLIDDEPVILAGAKAALSSLGYDVHTCEAWSDVARLVRETDPDLVLLDYNMPSLKGDYICTVLKNNIDENMNVYLYSSEPESELAEIARSCGADGYIPKNISAAKFAEWVQSVVQVDLDGA